VELIASSVHIPVCMHVCGTSQRDRRDLKYNVTVLDFEFSNNQANLDIISRRDLTGKMLGYGCVDSSVDEVETVPEIRKRIEKSVEYFDPKILLIDPDCGMRMRSRESRTGNSRTCAMRQRKSGSRCDLFSFFLGFSDSVFSHGPDPVHLPGAEGTPLS